MDLFEDILKQASNNTENAKQEIKKIDEECQKAKKCAQKEVKVSNPPTQKPKFVIPKIKPDDKPAVDITSYLQKREDERKKALIEKMKQKEELIKLRMQSCGGKATKNLAKQFGSTPIDLQQRYGNNYKHEQYLKKLEAKEKEEANRLNNEWRGSFTKALERKASGNRVVTERKSILKKSVTKEDFPESPIPVISHNSKSKNDAEFTAKRRLPPVESDFNLLMKKAETIQNGQIHRSTSPLPIPPPAKKNRVHFKFPANDIKETGFIDHKTKPKTTGNNNNNRLMTGQKSLRMANKTNKIKSSIVKQQKKASAAIPVKSAIADPQRRYLPGDIRYQGPPIEQLQSNNRKENNSSTAIANTVKNIKKDIQEKFPGRVSAEGRKTAENATRDRAKQKLSREEAIARIRARERMLREQRRHLEKLSRRDRDVSNEEDVEDEEYDSEMDDFIDDSELDEHLKRGDLEETLRLINPRYDKNRWKMREQMIDDRHMEASYQEIAVEEHRSYRIGLIEDIREAQRGKSIAL